MKVIGAGFGRTGTKSLQVALERLGFDPCYHMQEVMKNPAHAQVWQNALDGKPVAWEETFLSSYEAAVDWPACSFYRELMTAYPEAKVLLSVRDPERWYESTQSTIYQMIDAMPAWLTTLVPAVGKMHHMVMNLVWDAQFDNRFADRTHAIKVFNDWNEEVQRTVPAEKLLVYRVQEGWEPLCTFLGVPVPPEEFPHVNDRQEMLGNINRLRTIGWAVPLLLLLIVVLVLFWLFAPL